MKAIVLMLDGTEVEAKPEDVAHLVASWPNAKCATDLSDRKGGPRYTVEELIKIGRPLCKGCVEAFNRERDVPTALLPKKRQ